LQAVQCGYPVSFLIQNLASYDPSFPSGSGKFNLDSPPREAPMTVSWDNLLLSCLVGFALVQDALVRKASV
jgi:hypothetical protein